MFSASLRLGVKVTQKEKKERVDNMLEELGLVDCQNTLVGGEKIRARRETTSREHVIYAS